ncbi:MAG: hypothetical protein L0229_29335, partial [Blastocatellia bacterium]|nr:hypothetical protein [Blastocatellia bacterium]
GQSDEDHITFALVEQRVMVTHDADFLRYASTESNHYGIVYGHKAAHSIGHIIDSLILIYEVLTLEEMAGRVEYI